MAQGQFKVGKFKAEISVETGIAGGPDDDELVKVAGGSLGNSLAEEPGTYSNVLAPMKPSREALEGAIESLKKEVARQKDVSRQTAEEAARAFAERYPTMARRLVERPAEPPVCKKCGGDICPSCVDPDACCLCKRLAEPQRHAPWVFRGNLRFCAKCGREAAIGAQCPGQVPLALVNIRIEEAIADEMDSRDDRRRREGQLAAGYRRVKAARAGYAANVTDAINTLVGGWNRRAP